MIEDISRIHANEEAFRLCDFNALLHGHVRCPRAETFDSVLTERPTRSRERSLQDDLTGRIPYCVQRAKCLQRRCDEIGVRALWVSHFRESGGAAGICEEVAGCIPIWPRECIF